MSIVVAPPGAGKSHWLARQGKNTKWQEGDKLYKGDTRNLTEAKLKKFDAQNRKFKKQGKHVLTSIWYDPKVVDHAILIPMATLKRNLKGESRKGNTAGESVAAIKKHRPKRKIIHAKTFAAAMKKL